MRHIDETHDATRVSWVEGANGHHDFPIQNLPLGVFSPIRGGGPRVGTAIGEWIFDLAAAAKLGLLLGDFVAALQSPTLNALFALPATARNLLRHQISALLSDKRHPVVVEPLLHRASDCTLHLPAQIGDYTDFYVGIHHATNIGKLFRPDQPLLPNYKYIPIGYHGRASSVRPSDAPLVRPKGQRKAPDSATPTFGPTQRLDYELELGVWMGSGNALGETIPVNEAFGHIAGFCLLNDWSARDFQAWEYQPLGPFLAKNFLTTVSPWVITAEAMAPFRIAQPPRADGDPRPLDYLWDAVDQHEGALAIELEALLSTSAMRTKGIPPLRLSSGPASNMYWTVAEIITHHASNGCNLNPGDLLGTGTISAPTPDGYGSLMEISGNGKTPITLPNNETRTFLEDGDEITLTATAHAAGFVPIGFGRCVGTVLPSRP